MIEHGDFEIIRLNSIIVTRAKGPWNEESTIRFSKEMRRLVEELDDKPHGAIGIFHGESILIPQAEKQIDHLTRWRKERGLKCVALVLNKDSKTQRLRI